MNDSLLSLIYLFAFSNGVLLVAALWRKESSPAMLLALLLVMSYKLFEGAIYYGDYYKVLPHLYDLLPGAALIIGPLFYFYVLGIVNNKPMPKWKMVLHFMPIALLWCVNLPAVLQSGDVKIAQITAYKAVTEPAVLPIQIIVLLVILKCHLGAYLYGAWQQLSKLGVIAQQSRSDLALNTVTQLKKLCAALIALEALWVSLFLLQQLSIIDALHSVAQVWLLFMAVIVLAMGYTGLQQSNLMFSQDDSLFVAKPTKNDSELDIQTAQQIQQLIEVALAEKKLYLQDGLTLTQLANAIDLKPHLVSYVLNQHMTTNFYQLINLNRVNYAKNLLADLSLNWSVERIGLESGFSNRVSFNNAFKSITNTTPAAYRKGLKLAS